MIRTCLFLMYLVPAVLAVADMEVVSAYAGPAFVCHAILRNDGTQLVQLEGPGTCRVEYETRSALWVIAEPGSVMPGDFAFVNYAFTTPLDDPGTMPHHLIVGAEKILLYPDRNPPLAITHSVYAPDVRKIYLYIRNTSKNDITVASVNVGGVPVALEAPVTLVRGKKHLICGPCDPKLNSAYEVPQVCVRLASSDRVYDLASRLFLPKHTTIGILDKASDMSSCMTHEYATLDEAAAKAMEKATEQRGSLRTIKFCGVDVASKGPSMFGQMVERNHIEFPVDISSTRLSLSALLDTMEEAKRVNEPSMCTAWLFLSAEPSASRISFSTNRLRNAIYALLAGGSKGIEVFPPPINDANAACKRAIVHLLDEVSVLQDLLGISEPLDLLETPEPATFGVRTVVSGDRGLILFILPKDDPETTSDSSQTLSFVSPGFEVESQALEVGGAGRTVPLKRLEHGAFALEAPVETFVQVFVILPHV